MCRNCICEALACSAPALPGPFGGDTAERIALDLRRLAARNGAFVGSPDRCRDGGRQIRPGIRALERILLQPDGRDRRSHADDRLVGISFRSRHPSHIQENISLARNNRHLSLAANSADAPDVAGSAIVQVEDLARTYGTGPTAVRALDDVSLDIRKGEFLSLLGPSGCGKSTLLNILAGFDVPTEGRALFNGEPILGSSPNRGVVFQDSNALFPWMTIFRNVEFGLRSLRINRKERCRRVDAALHLVGLGDFAASYPRQLSGGMRQLAAIARIIVMNAELLLMDEPFAALDAITRQRMQKQFSEIWSRTRRNSLVYYPQRRRGNFPRRSRGDHVRTTRTHPHYYGRPTSPAARSHCYGLQCFSGNGFAATRAGLKQSI